MSKKDGGMAAILLVYRGMLAYSVMWVWLKM